MNILYKVILTLLFLMSYPGFSQDLKQQEIIYNAVKTRDSVMECITLEEMLQQEKNIKRNEKSNTQFKIEIDSLQKESEE